MNATKSRPRIGDRAYEVEWCVGIPLTEIGDGDLDNADYRRRIFSSLEDAKRYAAEVLPNDAFGVVMVTPMEFVPYDESDARRYPHVGFWEACGDPENLDCDGWSS